MTPTLAHDSSRHCERIFAYSVSVQESRFLVLRVSSSRVSELKVIISVLSMQGRESLTSLSNTHALSNCSGLLQCQSCWLLLSKHCQCFRNSSRQFLLMSSSLPKSQISPALTQLLDRPPCPCTTALSLLSSTFPNPYGSRKRRHSHTSSTPRNLPPLLHTFYLALPMRLRLALHVVIIVGAAPRSNEERRAE